MKIDPVQHSHLGYYRVEVTNPKTGISTCATTKLILDYNYWDEFRILDTERKGLVTKEELIEAMCTTDTYLTEKEIRKFIRNGDCIKADHVNYDEYVRYMKFARRNNVRPPGRALELSDGEKGAAEGEGATDEKTDKKKKNKGKGDKKKDKGNVDEQ